MHYKEKGKNTMEIKDFLKILRKTGKFHSNDLLKLNGNQTLKIRIEAFSSYLIKNNYAFIEQNQEDYFLVLNDEGKKLCKNLKYFFNNVKK